MIKEFWSSEHGKCEKCKDYGPVFYNDDGELLCQDCLFEKECEEDFYNERYGDF